MTTQPVPVFKGRVLPGGLLVLNQPRDYSKHVRSFAGQFVEVSIRRQRTKRSNDQNRWWWGIAIPMIAEAMGHERHEHEQVHYALVTKCFGTTVDERTGLEMPKVRSSKLSTAEFSELMEWAVRFAAQYLDAVIPLPNEVL